MTRTSPSTSRVSRTVTVLVIASLAVLALNYREQLGAWFTGKDNQAHGSPNASGSFNDRSSVGAGHASQDQTPSVLQARADVDHYTCSMHPSVNQPGPGKCPICGMDLIAVTKQQQAEGVVLLDERRRQLIGVRTAPVLEGPMQRMFRAVGRVTYDESALTDVNLKVSGWITKLLVNQTGQRVSRGQTLFALYSPELYAAQQDFLLAMSGARSDSPHSEGTSDRTEQLGRAARKRLSLLGLSEAQIDDIATGHVPLDTIPITSPASGFVIEKTVVEGASVQAATRLFRIAALDKVWIEADVYEEDLAHVRAGQRAKVTLDYLPDRAYDATVAYVYPYLDPAARTGRVRIALANQKLELRPGMYASVELIADLGSRIGVPASAVVYTGPRRLVFVDLGSGRFKPQEIRIGAEANGLYEVIDGLKRDDMVVTSGVFLIAAEARISTATTYWDNDAPQSPMSRAPVQTGQSGAQHAADDAVHDHAMPSGSPAPLEYKPEPIPAAAPSAIYRCPMHPEVRASTPGKCPRCGMELVPVANGKTP
jgi:Cu(I)/Ag(I) efflux system membrane fusion protein